MENECKDNSCELDINNKSVEGILTSLSHAKILLILRSHERKKFLQTLLKHGYRLAVIKDNAGVA